MNRRAELSPANSVRKRSRDGDIEDAAEWLPPYSARPKAGSPSDLWEAAGTGKGVDGSDVAVPQAAEDAWLSLAPELRLAYLQGLLDTKGSLRVREVEQTDQAQLPAHDAPESHASGAHVVAAHMSDADVYDADVLLTR